MKKYRLIVKPKLYWGDTWYQVQRRIFGFWFPVYTSTSKSVCDQYVSRKLNPVVKEY